MDDFIPPVPCTDFGELKLLDAVFPPLSTIHKNNSFHKERVALAFGFGDRNSMHTHKKNRGKNQMHACNACLAKVKEWEK
jgi:hypothetical protein